MGKKGKRSTEKNPLDYIAVLICTIIIVFFAVALIGSFLLKGNVKKIEIPDEILSSVKEVASPNSGSNNTEKTEEVQPEEPETFDSLKIIATGDIMCHNTQFKDAYKNGVYDFGYVFEDIKDYIEGADLAIGNLETTFPGNGKYSGYPQFNTPEGLITTLKEVGFDVLTTANNHCVDTGYAGVEGTLNTLDKEGILHTGTARSKEEQDTILITEVNGYKIAILAYTYGTNGIPIPKGKEFSVNLIDNDFIKEQLDKAKEQKPDLIIACMHWGQEYLKAPTKEQESEANFLFENGVDIIIGNHPHVLEPLEQRTIEYEGKQKEVFVVYSLGNLMSGQTQAGTRTSILLSLDLKKSSKTGDIKIETIDCIPIYTYTNPNYKNYKIMDIIKRLKAYDDGDKSISSTYVQTFRSELDRVTAMYEN